MEGSFPGNVSFISNLFFSWYSSVIKLGRQKVISADDALPLPESFRSKQIYYAFVNELKKHLATRPLSARVLWDAFHGLIFRNFWIGGMCRFFNDSFVLLGPVLIRCMISAVAAGNEKELVIYASLIFLNSCAQVLSASASLLTNIPTVIILTGNIAPAICQSLL
jgi:hypothetical protein